MHPTPRRRSAVACLLAAVLLLSLAAPVLASPPTDAPRTVLGDLLAWFARLVEGPSALDRATARDEAAPLIDPDGVTSIEPNHPLDDPDSALSTPPDDDGETAPLIDPDG